MDVGYLQVNAGWGGDTVTVQTTSAGIPITVNSGGGTDTVNVQSNEPGGTVYLDCGGGWDTVNVNTDNTGVAWASFQNTQHLGALNIGAGGYVRLEDAGGRVLRIQNALSINATGRLDLRNNVLIRDYSGASPMLVIKDWIKSAWNGGWWNSYGITTTLGNASTLGLGYGEASVVLGPGGGTFMGEVVDGTTVLVRYTRYGDSNLDGKVDIIDLGKVGTHWQSSGWWTEGDSNYGGFVDIVDLGMVGTNWQMSVPGVPASIWTEVMRLKRRGPRKGA
jgi:hypothetical protein